ncbi:MAG: translation initiation factor IF-3 [Candidatus Izemoplasmatales bacterium]
MFNKWVPTGTHFFIPWRCFNILYNNQKPVKKDTNLINEEIRLKQVLLIGADGYQYGALTAQEANRIAKEQGFDLVLVAPNAKPPVCKLMDYSKFRYEQQRKAREAKKHQKIVEVKEIRMTAVIDTHDFETKLRNGIKFLSKGNKLKVSVRLPYRAGTALIEQGKDVLTRFAESCAEVGELENKISHDGRFLSMVLSPVKQ